jgi:hypothetical protein
MSARVKLRIDPPAHELPGSRQDRQALADAMREAPLAWVLLGTFPKVGSLRTFAYEIRRAGHGWSMFGPEFEVETHTMLGEHRLYARWVGAGGR